MSKFQTRRHFMSNVSSAVAAGMLGSRGVHAAEERLETTTVRVPRTPTICFAPIYLVDAFLRAEGFTNVQYVPATDGISQTLASGRADLGADFAGGIVAALDEGLPVTALGGIHAGCYELFAHEPIQKISDLKGRRVGLQRLNNSAHLYLAVMVAYVGLDPRQDVDWVTTPGGDAMELFASKEADAFLGFPPEPQELRSRGINRIILNTVLDQPWSHYFCCMMYGNRAWIRDHPIATKRFLCALYKAAEFCSVEVERAAQGIVDGAFAEHYDHSLQTLREIPYDLWHEYDPEDTMRFYALWLHEAGMLSSTPNKILAEGTNWQFVNELKRELKT